MKVKAGNEVFYKNRAELHDKKDGVRKRNAATYQENRSHNLPPGGKNIKNAAHAKQMKDDMTMLKIRDKEETYADMMEAKGVKKNFGFK